MGSHEGAHHRRAGALGSVRSGALGRLRLVLGLGAALGVVRHDVAIDELPKPMVCLAVFELLGSLSSLLVDG